MNTCCETDPLTGENINCGTAEAEVIAEIDDCTDCGDGGGGPLPPPDDTDDPWLPPPDNGGGGVCTTCEPCEDPNDTDGEQVCPLGTINDGFDNCIGEEETEDCMGVEGGAAYLDSCGTCVGGTSGLQSCCASFDAIMTTVFNSEGGFSDREADKGGKTNKGISWKIWQVHAQTTLGVSPTVSNLQALTEEQAKLIYHAEFWQRSRVSNFLDGDLARMFFDFYINTNVGATTSIQKALSNLGYHVTVDGAMGPQTEQFINMAIMDGHLIELHNSFKDEMKSYYYTKANDDRYPKQKENEDGWINRVNKFDDKTEEETFNLHCDV